jgi:ferredoxin
MVKAIYYFSGTGNSLVVARDLAKELGEAALIPIAKAVREGADLPYDSIGIVFPVYILGIPLIVADFLKKLQVGRDTYIYAVATFGGLAGRALELTAQILGRRGIKLSAGFGVLMPGNYTPLYEAISADRQRAMFLKEKEKVKEIASAVREKRSGIMERSHPLISLLIYLVCYRLGAAQIRKEDKKYWTDDKCTGCGICEKVCPVYNIKMHDGRPVWLHHCEHCLACLQWCPVEAIQYKKITIGRKRYHHPEVKAADIMAQR